MRSFSMINRFFERTDWHNRHCNTLLELWTVNASRKCRSTRVSREPQTWLWWRVGPSIHFALVFILHHWRSESTALHFFVPFRGCTIHRVAIVYIQYETCLKYWGYSEAVRSRYRCHRHSSVWPWSAHDKCIVDRSSLQNNLARPHSKKHHLW